MDIQSSCSMINLSKMLAMLAEVSGQAIPDIIEHEVGKVLEKCISLTPSATEASVVKSVTEREFGMHKTGIEPKRPFKGKLTKKGYKRYAYKNRFPDAVWNEICKQRIESMNRRMSYIGISKQSWAMLADMAGLKIKVPKKVQKIPSKFYRNFEVTKRRVQGSYSITLVNAQPTVNRLGARRIVQRAIEGRAKYFARNLEKGVLSRMKDFEKAYPGLKITAPQGELE